MTIRDLFSATRTLSALGLLLGCGLGAWLGWQLAQPDGAKLVMPKTPEQSRALKLREQLQAPNLTKDKQTVQAGPMWQLTPEGADLFAAAGAPGTQAAPVAGPPQEWTMVARVNRPDGIGLVLYQKQTQVSKFFKVTDKLPDGRKILSIDSTGFVLAAAKGKKRERFEYAAGLMVTEPPEINAVSTLSATASVKPSATAASSTVASTTTSAQRTNALAAKPPASAPAKP